MSIASLVALEEGGIQKCGMTELFVFLETLYLLAAGGEIWLITRVFCCLRLDFVCDVGVLVAQLRYCSLQGRNVVVGCSAAGNVEHLLRRLQRLVYQ